MAVEGGAEPTFSRWSVIRFAYLTSSSFDTVRDLSSSLSANVHPPSTDVWPRRRGRIREKPAGPRRNVKRLSQLYGFYHLHTVATESDAARVHAFA